MNVNTPITLEICGRLGQWKTHNEIVAKMQHSKVILEVADSGDLSTVAVIARDINA